jgi:CRP-like cAMP-binding protein
MNNSMHIDMRAKNSVPVSALTNASVSSIVKNSYINAPDSAATWGGVRPIGMMQNHLLATLSDQDLALLMPHLQLVELAFNAELHEYGTKVTHVYFPTTAIIALLYTLSDGGVTEIGVIGREGLLGISVLMGDRALGTAVVQNRGYAYKLKTSVLQELCTSSPTLQQFLMRYAHALFAQITQNTVCGRHYSIEQQLSRWLLDRLDRLPANELKVTQELISKMLGVRRESITEAAGRLQLEGVIQCRRGNITVLDRKRLEKNAGECYQVVKLEHDLMCA